MESMHAGTRRFSCDNVLAHVSQVENALKATPGIQEAAVSLVTHRAEVR